ncbi:MAG TPA: DUF664 domain-containing protein, partial [Microlunatus sp.]|nr:DUF664 domain-containing protein [Microlunatus sp.]
MTVIDEQGRPEPPVAAGEAETLIGFLEFHRSTLEWKCSGLDAGGLRSRLGASTMTLGGLLKHLAYVEDIWFTHRLHGGERAAVWQSAPFDTDPDWDWTSAADDSPEELWALWREAVDRSRRFLAEALRTGGLDQPAERPMRDGRVPSARW